MREVGLVGDESIPMCICGIRWPDLCTYSSSVTPMILWNFMYNSLLPDLMLMCWRSGEVWLMNEFISLHQLRLVIVDTAGVRQLHLTYCTCDTALYCTSI